MKLNLTDIIGYYNEFENNQTEDIYVEERELQQYFANGLKRIRKFRKSKLKDISRTTEIPITSIVRYENGENSPSIIQALKFAEFYKITIERITEIGYLEEMEAEELIAKLEENYKLVEELLESKKQDN